MTPFEGIETGIESAVAAIAEHVDELQRRNRLVSSITSVSINDYRAEVACAPNFAYDLCVDRFRPAEMAGEGLRGVADAGKERLEPLERAFALVFRDRMQEEGIGSAEAVPRVSREVVFTTHTPAPAGFDRFPPALIEKFMRQYDAEAHLGPGLRDLLALGRENPDDPNEPFNMAYLAIRGSGAINGVSRRLIAAP